VVRFTEDRQMTRFAFFFPEKDAKVSLPFPTPLFRRELKVFQPDILLTPVFSIPGTQQYSEHPSSLAVL